MFPWPLLTRWLPSLSPPVIQGVTAIALGVIFVADTLTSLGFAHGTLYPIVVVAAGLTRRMRWVGGVTIGAMVLTGLGFWVSAPAPPDFPIGYVIANRLLSVVTIATTGGLTCAVLRYLQQVNVSRQALDDTYNTLRSQQTLLEIASTAGHLGGWMVNLEQNTCIWSDEVARIHGMEPEFSPTVQEAINFYAPEYRDRLTEVFTACARDGIPFDEELQIITAQGQRVWVRSIGHPVRNDRGQITKVQGAFQDITQQKEIAASLALSQQRFRQLADAMPLIVWTAEPDGTVDYASQALRDYTGILEPEPHPSQYWLTLLHPDDQEPCIAAWTTAVEREGPYEIEFRIHRDDGVYCWFLTRAVPIRNESGDIIKWFGTSTNIHDQKQLEHNASQLAHRLNTILESITDGFVNLDSQWRFTFVNRQAEKLLRRNREELLGKSMWDEFPDAVGSPFQQRYEQAVASGETVEFREFYAPLDRWLDIRVYPSQSGISIYFQDVSDRIALEEQLRQSQRLEAIGQLTGGVAHDFNNLLTVILGNAELLAEMLADAQLHPLVEMIAGAAQRGAELTQRLLAFARRQPLDPKMVNVNQLVGQMDGLLRHTLGEHVEIETIQAAGLWPTLVDPTQLESALLNLCLNARDAMVSGGRLTLETANTRLDQSYADHHKEVQPGQYILVAVSDTGTGIDPEHLGRVFEPFFTTKARGKGTGLGLSMAYGFIKQSGGHIKIYSELGEGTTVKLYLPRHFDTTTLDQSDEATGGNPAPQGESALILLVEDDELVRRYVEDQLRSLGYRVLSATNGPAALEIIRQRQDIDLLFTDVVMPGGMSGRDLADQARALYPHLKVLYTSGYTENAIVHQGRLDPGVHLLSKPYRRAELARKIREVLEEV